MKVRIVTLVFCLCAAGIAALTPGCAILGPIVDNVIAVVTNNPSVVTNVIDVVTPPVVAPDACGCDLTRGYGMPLVPEFGATDAEVNATLYHRWLDVDKGGLGLQDGCTGLERDVRPLLIRLQGGTYGWKYILTDHVDGGPRIVFNGDMMTVYCGVWHGERYHGVGKSDKEWDNGKTPTDFETITPGIATLQKHFVSFRKVNQ